ncbi:hypothetical protein LCGC14_3000490, partial [marine sediment metagenome]
RVISKMEWDMHRYLKGFNGFFENLFKFFFFLIDVIIVKYLLRTKIIWTVHNLYSHETQLPSIERLGRRILAKIADGNIISLIWVDSPYEMLPLLTAVGVNLWLETFQ